MKVLNYRRQLLFSGLLFTLHNIEESVGYAYFSYPSGLKLPFPLPAVVPMVWAIALITLIAWAVILWANSQKKENIRRNVLTFFTAIFLLNAFIPHIAGAVVLQRYVPAVVTSVVLYLPYSFWIIPKLYRSYPAGRLFYVVAFWGVFISILLVAVLKVITDAFFR